MATDGSIPDWWEREQARRKRVEQNRLDAKPLEEAIRKLGVDISSLDDLVNRNFDYKIAVPLLLDWLPRVQNQDVKSAIVRALTVKFAKPEAAKPLLKEFMQAQVSSGGDIKWVIGNALSVVADDSVFDELVALLRDRRHGRDREMLAWALGNMKNPRAADVLIEMLDDEQVAGHAIAPLGKLKAIRAKGRLEQFLNHPKAWIRKAAKTALARISKAEHVQTRK